MPHWTPEMEHQARREAHDSIVAENGECLWDLCGFCASEPAAQPEPPAEPEP